jgi:hypothetical protein
MAKLSAEVSETIWSMANTLGIPPCKGKKHLAEPFTMKKCGNLPLRIEQSY